MHWSFVEPVLTQEFTHTDSGARLSWLTTFRHHQFSPATSTSGFDCHENDILRFKNAMGRVEGGPHPARRPSGALQPREVSTRSVFAPTISIERLDADVATLGSQDFRDRYDRATEGMRVWRPSHRFPGTSTIVSWGEGASATSIEVPQVRSVGAGGSEAQARVLAARTLPSGLVLLREIGDTWELSEFDLATGTWRRLYVALADPEAIRPVVWKFNSFHPVVEALEVREDGIEVRGLSMRHGYGGNSVGVDNGFRMSFPRP
jgi:hypothetical protein